MLELGSGYGLAGFAIAACTDASEVIISDGNPQVIECILLNKYYNINICIGYLKIHTFCSLVIH